MGSSYGPGVADACRTNFDNPSRFCACDVPDGKCAKTVTGSDEVPRLVISPEKTADIVCIEDLLDLGVAVDTLEADQSDFCVLVSHEQVFFMRVPANICDAWMFLILIIFGLFFILCIDPRAR